MIQNIVFEFILNQTRFFSVDGKLRLDPNKVNINVGAISLGHPLGCTGAKLTIQIAHDLKRLGKKYGIVTACIGGGQCVAGIIERM